MTKRRAVLLMVVGACAVALAVALPPRARAVAPLEAGLAVPVRGAMHVHTRRSDGAGTIDQVAAAARRAGLKFVILTDHGDGTRPPEPATYRGGVLCIDGVEISTEAGHLVALGLARAPYPLGGEPRDVLEDVARMGGFSVAAHPASAKPDLRWFEWTAPIDGLEWLNGDSEWRDEAPWRLARALFTYPLRRAETIATLLDRPDAVIRRWDVLTGRRRVVALAGSDAHARVGLPMAADPYQGRFDLPVPGYAAMFRTFSIALPQATLSGNAIADEHVVLEEIRSGRVYSTVDALAGPAAFAFTASSGSLHAVGGEPLAIQGPVTLRARVQAPTGARLGLFKNGRLMLDVASASLEQATEERPAVYRIEVTLPDAPGEPRVPWIVSNPIYVGRGSDDVAPPARHAPASERRMLYQDGPAAGWEIAQGPLSQGVIHVVPAVSGTQLLFRYALSGRTGDSPFAALSVTLREALPGFDRLAFRAHADRPMRLSVQLRVPRGEPGERWHRSVFIDTLPRDVTVFFDELMPRGITSSLRPNLADVHAILFVIDTVNTAPGTSGQIWLDEVRLERGTPTSGR